MKNDPPEEFKKECLFTWFTSGMHTSSLRLTHIPSGNVVTGNTQGTRFKLQKKLLKELWIKCQDKAE